ncbi:MAG: hypothetical protein N4A63_08190 [Vallitalea sp.]|nr:hypothetical protein [Vallitalea sp.]
MKENVKYIYNLDQINFYLENGIKPRKIDIHKVTKKAFAIFSTEETEVVYQKWCKQCKEYNKN